MDSSSEAGSDIKNVYSGDSHHTDQQQVTASECN